MKKAISFILAAALSASLMGMTANADETEADKKFTIGFSDFSLTAEYQAKLRDKILEYAKEKYGDALKFVVLDGESDSDTQNSGIDNLINQKVDAIIMVPFDAQQQIPAVQAAVDAEIPMFEVCLQTADDGLRTCFVGSDDTKSGEMAMEYLAKQLDGKGNVVYLHGPTGQDSEIKRHEGANKVLDKNPDMKLVAEKVCNWDRAEAMTAIENVLQSGTEVNAIFSENDEMALGAFAAIEGTENEGKILISGVDGISDSLTAIKEGDMACTSFQDAGLQASTVVDAVWNYLNGEKIEDYYEVPYQLITADNVDDDYWTK